jgi:lactobin A/cerein 7B family class IIb bacteriocin
MNLQNNNAISELSYSQMREVNGGIEPVSTALAVAGLALAVVAFCYSVGKDCAESDRRN